MRRFAPEANSRPCSSDGRGIPPPAGSAGDARRSSAAFGVERARSRGLLEKFSLPARPSRVNFGAVRRSRLYEHGREPGGSRQRNAIRTPDAVDERAQRGFLDERARPAGNRLLRRPVQAPTPSTSKSNCGVNAGARCCAADDQRADPSIQRGVPAKSAPDDVEQTFPTRSRQVLRGPGYTRGVSVVSAVGLWRSASADFDEDVALREIDGSDLNIVCSRSEVAGLLRSLVSAPCARRVFPCGTGFSRPAPAACALEAARLRGW